MNADEGAQDPDELFDVCDARGRPLGSTKRRADVHRDGDWHASVHLWVVLERGVEAPLVVLQRRGSDKDTWPGALDVAVTGHFAAGETLDDALREAEEEIGLLVTPSEVVRLGLRHRRDTPRVGLRDNEHQHICAVVRRERLGELSPSPRELEALLAVEWPAFLTMMGPSAERVSATELSPATRTTRIVSIRADELVPATDGYYARALASLADLLRGATPEPWEIG